MAMPTPPATFPRTADDDLHRAKDYALQRLGWVALRDVAVRAGRATDKIDAKVAELDTLIGDALT